MRVYNCSIAQKRQRIASYAIFVSSSYQRALPWDGEDRMDLGSIPHSQECRLLDIAIKANITEIQQLDLNIQRLKAMQVIAARELSANLVSLNKEIKKHKEDFSISEGSLE